MQLHLITKAIINQVNVSADGVLPAGTVLGSALRLNQTTANIQLILPAGIEGQELTVYNSGTVPVYVGDAGLGYFVIGVNAGLSFFYTGSNWIPVTIYPLYSTAGKTNTQALLLGASDITWDSGTVTGRGITFNAGSNTWTLPANRTYFLQAMFLPTLAAVAYSIQWVNSSNVAIGSLNVPATGLASLSHVHAISVFRPTVDTDVKLRSNGGLGVTLGTSCFADIASRD